MEMFLADGEMGPVGESEEVLRGRFRKEACFEIPATLHRWEVLLVTICLTPLLRKT